MCDIVANEYSAYSITKKGYQLILWILNYVDHGVWKNMLNIFFKEFIEFFFPDIADDIDWTKAPIFMDKELKQDHKRC